MLLEAGAVLQLATAVWEHLIVSFSSSKSGLLSLQGYWLIFFSRAGAICTGEMLVVNQMSVSFSNLEARVCCLFPRLAFALARAHTHTHTDSNVLVLVLGIEPRASCMLPLSLISYPLQPRMHYKQPLYPGSKSICPPHRNSNS